MANEATYVQIVRTSNGKYVYEARDGGHAVVETSKEYAKESAAAQAAADAYPHQYDETGNLLSLGVPVRHAVVNGGEVE